MKVKFKGEGKIENGIYLHQGPATIDGRMGWQMTEETIVDGKGMYAQGWFEPIGQIENKGRLIKYDPIE